MSNWMQWILAVNNFSTGLIIPVFNLILMERGASLQSLPLLLALYAITIICLELPSGICADIFGRKVVFLLSCIFQAISFVILIVANNSIWLAFAIIFLGMGRAFSSGSLDALLIDHSVSQNGETILAKVTSRMAIMEGIGLAAGGIIGGLICSITGTYLLNIIIRLGFLLILFFLSLIYIKETVVFKEGKRISFHAHFQDTKKIFISKPQLSFLLIGVFFLGFFLFTLETYWQSAFIKIVSFKGNSILLGFLTFLGFLFVTVGNICGQKLMERYKNSWLTIYNACRFTFAACVLIFSFQKNYIGFMICYAFLYFVLGVCNVAEATLVNKWAPSQMRASILSLNSFIAQAGGLCASVFSSLTILKLQFSGVWVVAGGLIGGYALLFFIKLQVKKIKTIHNTDAEEVLIFK